MKTLITLAAALALAGCVSEPKIDFSKSDKQCSARCTTEYSKCNSGFHMSDWQNQRACNAAIKMCAATCGATVTE